MGLNEGEIPAKFTRKIRGDVLCKRELGKDGILGI